MRPPIIAVIGSADCPKTSKPYRHAQAVGRLIAKHGYPLVTGGFSGVMEAASKGAHQAGGTVIGIIKGSSTEQANPYVTIPIATGMGDARNAVIANTADGFVAVGGEFGTLSEIAYVLKRNKPIISLGSWDVDGRVPEADTPEEAVAQIIKKCKARCRKR